MFIMSKIVYVKNMCLRASKKRNIMRVSNRNIVLCTVIFMSGMSITTSMYAEIKAPDEIAENAVLDVCAINFADITPEMLQTMKELFVTAHRPFFTSLF